MSTFERDVPLKACPDLSCWRKKHCLLWADDRHCLVTHYRNDDEWQQDVIDLIHELQKYGDPDPKTKYLSGEERAAYIHKLLKDRAKNEGWVV